MTTSVRWAGVCAESHSGMLTRRPTGIHRASERNIGLPPRMRHSIRQMPNSHEQTGDVVKERAKTKKQEPKQFKVVLLNDDYTTMEFVVSVLETVFQKSPAEAFKIMMSVHMNGRGIAGVYPWEVAETKVE